MRIKEITSEHILFDNGNYITFWHCPDCCEENYADFSQLDSEASDYDFDEDLKFEIVPEAGFRFGDKRMFFIPCYSDQNGYYSDDVEISYIQGFKVLSHFNVQAEMILR